MEEAKIPFRDVRRCRGRDGVGVEQLAGDERQAEDDAQALGRAHFLCDRPADADRQHMEDGFANQPQEAVNAGPELADVAQRLGAVIKKVDAVNAVAEAENQTAGDDGRNQRGKNLRKHAHDLLQCVLVLLGCALDSFLRDTVNAGYRNKVIVEIADRIADDDLELARLGESALGGFQCLDLGNVRLGGIVQHKTHPGYTVRNCRDVLFAANILKQQLCVFLVFSHDSFLLYFLMIRQTCSYKFGLWFQYSSLVQTSQADLQKIMLCLKIFSISDKRMP